jgi:hypothetical protein
MWMVQGGERSRFALESGHPIGIGGERARDQFQRDIPAEPRVARTEYLAHPAGAKGSHNFVRPEASARPQRHEVERAL